MRTRTMFPSLSRIGHWERGVLDIPFGSKEYSLGYESCTLEVNPIGRAANERKEARVSNGFGPPCRGFPRTASKLRPSTQLLRSNAHRLRQRPAHSFTLCDVSSILPPSFPLQAFYRRECCGINLRTISPDCSPVYQKMGS